jgi:hypothetical protein
MDAGLLLVAFKKCSKFNGREPEVKGGAVLCAGPAVRGCEAHAPRLYGIDPDLLRAVLPDVLDS